MGDSIKHIIHGDRDSFGIDEVYIGFLLSAKSSDSSDTLHKIAVTAIYRFTQPLAFHFANKEKQFHKNTHSALKIEAITCYNSFGKLLGVEAGEERKNNPIRTMYILASSGTTLDDGCCFFVVSIFRSFAHLKFGRWKRGLLCRHTHTHTHCYTTFSLFSHKMFCSFARSPFRSLPCCSFLPCFYSFVQFPF